MAENILVNVTLDCHDTRSLLKLVTRHKAEVLEWMEGRALNQHSGGLCSHGDENVGKIQELIELLQTLQPLVGQHVQSPPAETRDDRGRLKRDSGVGSTTSTELGVKKNTDSSCSVDSKSPPSSSNNVYCKECTRRQSALDQETVLRSYSIKEDKNKLAFRRKVIHVGTNDSLPLPEDLDNKHHEDDDDISPTMIPKDKTEYQHIHQSSQTHPKSVEDSRPGETSEEDTLLDADAKDGAGKTEKDAQ